MTTNPPLPSGVQRAVTRPIRLAFVSPFIAVAFPPPDDGKRAYWVLITRKGACARSEHPVGLWGRVLVSDVHPGQAISAANRGRNCRPAQRTNSDGRWSALTACSGKGHPHCSSPYSAAWGTLGPKVNPVHPNVVLLVEPWIRALVRFWGRAGFRFSRVTSLFKKPGDHPLTAISHACLYSPAPPLGRITSSVGPENKHPFPTQRELGPRSMTLPIADSTRLESTPSTTKVKTPHN